MSNLGGCTCGPYMSVIPPEPCPIHDPERAYWRMKLLREFGGYESTSGQLTTGVVKRGGGFKTGAIQTEHIKKYEAPVPPEPIVHFNSAVNVDVPDALACGADPAGDVRWARVEAWVTCGACLSVMNVA